MEIMKEIRTETKIIEIGMMMKKLIKKVIIRKRAIKVRIIIIMIILKIILTNKCISIFTFENTLIIGF